MSDLEAILSAPAGPVTSHGPVPETLAHLFDKDPLDLTEQDLGLIVKTMRAQREAFLKEELDAKNSGRRPSYAKGQKKAALDIDKLDF